MLSERLPRQQIASSRAGDAAGLIGPTNPSPSPNTSRDPFFLAADPRICNPLSFPDQAPLRDSESLLFPSGRPSNERPSIIDTPLRPRSILKRQHAAEVAPVLNSTGFPRLERAALLSNTAASDLRLCSRAAGSKLAVPVSTLEEPLGSPPTHQEKYFNQACCS